MIIHKHTATPNPTVSASSTPISCNTSQTSSTSGLAPANIAVCGESIESIGIGGAKWYKLTGVTAGQTVTITTCSATTNFDTQLSVWGDKATSSTCIGGNDDDCGLQSTVSFEASGDEDILVHGYSSSEGNFELIVTCVSVSNWFVEYFPPFLIPCI